MSLNKMLQEADAPQRIEVTSGDATFVVEGMPNADVLGEVFMMTEDQTKKRASHFARVTKGTFSEKLVKNVLLIQPVLIMSREDAPEGTSDEDLRTMRYDETTIAALAGKKPILFLKLLEAAVKVQGFADEESMIRDMSDDPVLRAAVGKSENAADTEHPLSTGASMQPGNIPTSSVDSAGLGAKSTKLPESNS